jgi:hypothetical protein
MLIVPTISNDLPRNRGSVGLSGRPKRPHVKPPTCQTTKRNPQADEQHNRIIINREKYPSDKYTQTPKLALSSLYSTTHYIMSDNVCTAPFFGSLHQR